MSIRLSVCQPRLGGNVIFSAPNWDIAPIFFVQIPLINEHLFCKYFVRLSVGNATKGFATYGCFHPCLLSEFNFYGWKVQSEQIQGTGSQSHQCKQTRLLSICTLYNNIFLGKETFPTKYIKVITKQGRKSISSKAL